jgi:hypothetical protein
MYEARIAAAHEKERAMTKATVDFDQLLALQQERDALAAKVRDCCALREQLAQPEERGRNVSTDYIVERLDAILA